MRCGALKRKARVSSRPQVVVFVPVEIESHKLGARLVVGRCDLA